MTTATTMQSSSYSVGLSPGALTGIRAVVQKHVDAGKTPGAVVLIAQNGSIVYEESIGRRDVGANAPMAEDSIFALASMSKPFTAVAILQLIDRGALQLHDRLHVYAPSLRAMKLYNGQGAALPAGTSREITIEQLLTHTSGLSYGAVYRPETPISNLYYERGVHHNRLVRDGTDCSKTLSEMIDRLSEMPLAYEPGTSWEYSIASDVLAYVVEQVSQERFDQYLQRHIFDPLRMLDTGYFVPPQKRDRLATIYELNEGKIVPTDVASRYFDEPTYFGGGGDLLSTAPDYFRFAQMLLNGGELEGARVLRPETVAQMASNHLTDVQRTAMVKQLGPGLRGYGFGYGVAVGLDPAPQSNGFTQEFYWNGGAGTRNWIDPVHKMVGIVMNHVRFSQVPAIDAEVKGVVRQALGAGS